MQKRLWALPLLVLLATSSQAAFAEEEWEDCNNRGAAAIKDGKYAEAEKLLLSARKEAEKSGPKYGHYSTTLLNLGLLYDKTDKIAESEKAYKEALAIYETASGPSTIEDSKSLQGLADMYRHHGKFNEAMPLYLRALKIRDILCPTAPDTSDTLNGLAEIYRKQGKNVEALPLLKRALDIRREAFGATSTKVGRSLDNLAGTYAILGKYDMAVPIYKDLLSVRETDYGVDDPKVAQTLEDLGYACAKTDKPKKAESSFKRALAIREKHAKEEPAALTACRKRYADFLKGAGRAPEAAVLESKTTTPTTVVKAGAASAPAAKAPGKTASK